MMPSARTAEIQLEMMAGSKHIWVVMYEAYGSLSLSA